MRRMKCFASLLLCVLMMLSLWACVGREEACDANENKSGSGGTGTGKPTATEPSTTAKSPSQTTEKAEGAVLPPSNQLQFDQPKAGIYNYCPSVMRLEDGTYYAYYCTNRNSYEVIDVIGCRKGTANEAGTVIWGEETVALTPTEGAWDAHHTCDPSVIAGQFRYGGEEYSYLMAYLGCTSYDNQENKLGLAVAKSPEGPFVKVGSQPIVDFTKDPAVSTFQWGVGQASLVSRDRSGKVWMFYTRGDVNGTRTVVRECDFSSLDAPVVGNEIRVGTLGLTNLNSGADFMNNADFVYDAEKNCFYATSDCHPNPADTPDYISSHFRVTRISGTNFATAVWTSVKTVGPTQTGFARNHNTGFVRDAYGHLCSREVLTVLYSMSVTGNDSLWSYRIYDYHVSLNA